MPNGLQQPQPGAHEQSDNVRDGAGVGDQLVTAAEEGSPVYLSQAASAASCQQHPSMTDTPTSDNLQGQHHHAKIDKVRVEARWVVLLAWVQGIVASL